MDDLSTAEGRVTAFIHYNQQSIYVAGIPGIVGPLVRSDIAIVLEELVATRDSYKRELVRAHELAKLDGKL